jgi:osmotically-inducible protein OsmY
MFGRDGAWRCVSACLMLASLTLACRGVDGDVRQAALARLASDPVTAQPSVSVTVRSGVLTVSGDIANRDEERRIVEAVRQTPGVMDVINDLRIDDRIISGNVKAAFGADPMVQNVPVDITSDDGVLTLRSTQTNEEQRRRMLQLASAVDGVIDIVDDMQ